MWYNQPCVHHNVGNRTSHQNGCGIRTMYGNHDLVTSILYSILHSAIWRIIWSLPLPLQIAAAVTAGLILWKRTGGRGGY